MHDHNPGLIALIGSGETTRFGGLVFERLIKKYPQKSRVAILETPAGFEVNSPLVAGRVARYLSSRLQNYLPDVTVIPARKRNSEFSPDDPAVVKVMAESALIFMGPGSPSYAVRQLRGSLAWELICAKFWRGTSLAVASAAAVAFGKYSLPVYEIYKVGQDLHWLKGLDFLGSIGLEMTVIPHWNNREGGEELDTSHCFMGKDRFDALLALLPASVCVAGMDELTTLVIDLAGRRCDVMGPGRIHLIRGGREKVFEPKTSFDLSELGEYRPTRALKQWSAGIENMLAESMPEGGREIIPQEVAVLAEKRQRARDRKNWKAADLLRKQIESLGWQTTDTPEGHVLKNIKD